jgi:uncharacterized protein YdhG (YjbR/CyaY superfamily)
MVADDSGHGSTAGAAKRARTTPAKKAVTKKTSTKSTRGTGLSAAEQAAVRERAREVAKERRPARAKRDRRAEGLADVLAAIAALPEPDRTIVDGLHALITDTAPDLEPRTWYGMPAYARDGKVVCFVQAAAKFTTRYSTLGFNDVAKLDDGAMWPTAFAVVKLDRPTQARIRDLIVAATA